MTKKHITYGVVSAREIEVSRNRDRAWVQSFCTVAILHQGAHGVIAVKEDDFTSLL
jgi:hypothetical protein